jgi:hypothetical protein
VAKKLREQLRNGMKPGALAGSIEPILVTIANAAAATGESEWQVRQLVSAGIYEAKKAGRRTLIVYAGIKKRVAGLPTAELCPPRRPNIA